MFDLSEDLNRRYGNHRAGWVYALDCMRELHSDHGTKVISFVEKKFVFGSEVGEARNGFQQIHEPWIGFVHCPLVIPIWFNHDYSPEQFFRQDNFQQAMRHCVGLYSLSTPLAVWLRERFPGPVDVVLHPTELVARTFSTKNWCRRRARKVIQLGFWLRRLNAIWNLPLPGNYTKVIVGVNQPWQKNMLYLEREILGEAHDDGDVTWHGLLSNEAYDELLTSAIVFIDFYDTSANNAIVECIARGIPVVCPPSQAVVDYLGAEYPLYFRSYLHAAELCMDDVMIERAHMYMMESGIREAISPRRFIENLRMSAVFRNTSSREV